ncbi:MAG: peptidoglycan-binding protein [Oscillospiraceae bacterium]|nr:peptidoglycan-binding protein [Oscillospiraceae bacterium]
MSDKNQARRVRVEAAFAGKDITRSLLPYLKTITYTDNEEDETDDLQFQLHDREGVWLTGWLGDVFKAAVTQAQPAAATAPVATAVTATKMYRVTSNIGLYVRSGPGSGGNIGTLVWGAQIVVKSISNGWACIDFRGKTGYVSAKYIAEISVSNTAGWVFGEKVTVSGQPQYSSYGVGTPGAAVSNRTGHITGLNLASGIKYPIHVDQMGWFAESQVKKADDTGGGTAAVTAPARVPGFTIQAKFVRDNWHGDGVDKVLDSGQFELDAVTCDGPPAVINIKATSLPYGTRLRQTEKNRAWEAVSLSGIAKEMARNGGMACLFESVYDPYYERQEQVHTSDIQFLSELCHRAGISLKVINNIIVLFDQTIYEKKAPVFDVRRGDGTYSKYRLQTGETRTKYTSCRVSYTDPATGKKIEAIFYMNGCRSNAFPQRPTLRRGSKGQDVRDMQKLLVDRGYPLPKHGVDGLFGPETESAVKSFQRSNKLSVDGVCGPKTWAALESTTTDGLNRNGQQLEITAKVASYAEALTLAEKMLRLRNKKGLTASFTFPFDPGRVAGITCTLSGWGPWSGKYIITQAKHTAGGSASTTQVSLRQVLEGY